MDTRIEQKSKILYMVNQALNDFENITIDAWNYKQQPLKWSKKELLGHLIDSASNNLRRLIVSQYEQGTKIIYNQNEWVSYQNYQESDIDEIKMLWKLLNNQISRVIECLPIEKLQNLCDSGKGEIDMHTLDYFINDYILHLKHHLKQLTA